MLQTQGSNLWGLMLIESLNTIPYITLPKLIVFSRWCLTLLIDLNPLSRCHWDLCLVNSFLRNRPREDWFRIELGLNALERVRHSFFDPVWLKDVDVWARLIKNGPSQVCNVWHSLAKLVPGCALIVALIKARQRLDQDCTFINLVEVSLWTWKLECVSIL